MDEGESGRSSNGDVSPKRFLTNEEAKELLQYLLMNIDSELPVRIEKE